MRRVNILPILLFFILVSCATQMPRPKLASKKNDLFRNESFSQYSIENLNLITTGHFNGPIALCHKGKISEGLKLLQKKVSSFKTNPLYWLHVANCYYLSNKFDMAKFYYNISLDTSKRKDSRKALAYNNLGVLYLKNNHILEAKDYLEKSIKSDPYLVTAKYNLGQIYIKYGLLKEAKKLLLPLERNNSSSIELLSALGTIYALENNSNKAINYFMKIPEDLRKRDDIALSYAMALFVGKKYEQAKSIISGRLDVGLKSTKEMASKLEDAINNKLKEIEKTKEEAKKRKKKG